MNRLFIFNIDRVISFLRLGSKHFLPDFRLMQKYLIPVINCLLCCINWYSWGVIRKSHRIGTCSHRIGTCSHRIRMAVKFYNHTLLHIDRLCNWQYQNVGCKSSSSVGISFQQNRLFIASSGYCELVL